MERRNFNADDHVRRDWTSADCAYFLETRARGYDGLLRAYLCTGASMLRQMAAALRSSEADLAACKANLAMLVGEPVEMGGDTTADEVPELHETAFGVVGGGS